jgi:hypothetical protein
MKVNRTAVAAMETGAFDSVRCLAALLIDVRGFDIASGHLLPERAAEAVTKRLSHFSMLLKSDANNEPALEHGDESRCLIRAGDT